MDDLLRPRLAAQRLLRWWREAAVSDAETARDTAPTPVDTLAERLGLEVAPFHPGTRRSGTLGWLEPGEDVIFLREDLPEPVRRFTLAHELGHALLHRVAGPPAAVALALDLAPDAAAATEDEADDESAGAAIEACDNVDLDAPLDPLSLGDETLRPGQTYSARARRESEANAFAAALLLPPDRLHTLFLGGAENEAGSETEVPGLPPRALAERFGVSEDTVHQALAALLPPGANLPGGEQPAPVSRLGGSSARPALDRWQRAAASAEAPALVVAGPGTGKTSTLVGRVAHLVFERGVDAGHLLALTFSNKAAQEMRERLNALLSDSAGTSGSRARPVVSTIHSFCGDLLRRYAPRVGLRPDFRLITEAEGYLLLREVAGDMALGYYQPLGNPAMHFPALLAAISRAKDELADPARYEALARAMRARAHTAEEHARAERALEAARVYAAYQRALAERGDADFGDLIFLAVRLLREQPDVLAELRARHTHLLVDEFQDINHAMGMLLSTLAGPSGPLWAVGDADQAIYRFRGAAPSNLAQFTALYPDARIYPLGTNYRSRPPILHAAAAVAGAFLGEGARRVLEAGYLAPVDPTSQLPSPEGTGSVVAEPVITLATAPDEAAELAGLATAIRARTARGYALADQAVLCRTRRQGQRVAAALAAAGLPARIVTPLLDQPDVKDILSVILLLADASGAGLLRAGHIRDHAFGRAEARAVLDAAHAQQAAPLGMLLDAGSPLAEVEGLSPEGLSGLARLGVVLADLWTAPDVATGLARYVFTLTGIARRALGDSSAVGRAAAANLARLLALARAFEHQRRGAQPTWYHPQAGDARWDEFVDYLRVLTALGREPGAAADELVAVASDGVRVLTVHGSKGLEFPVVYLPGLAAGRFPAQRRGETAPPPVGLSAGDPDEAIESHLVEEACLFYVALTRARDALVVSHAERYGRRRYAPSPFLRPLAALASDAASGAASAVARAQWPAARAGLTQGDQASATEPEAAGAEPPSEPPPPPEEALRPAAIETYQRCPRQYAYRYVYQLRPREVNLATLRRGLHETLRELQERFATAGEASPQALPSLDDAQALFERHWRAAVAADAARRPSAGCFRASIRERGSSPPSY